MRLSFCKEEAPRTPHLADVCRVQPQMHREDQSSRNPELLPTEAELLFQQVFFPSLGCFQERRPHSFCLLRCDTLITHISVLMHVCERAAKSQRDVLISALLLCPQDAG